MLGVTVRDARVTFIEMHDTFRYTVCDACRDVVYDVRKDPCIHGVFINI